MAERVAFDGRAWVDYRQIVVLSGDELGDFDQAFAGQSNGLLGAGAPGRLVLVGGTHTGEVGLRVVVHDGAPPVDTRWEDVVEASFVPANPDVTVTGLMSDEICRLRLPAAAYRVRWSGVGIDEAYDGVVSADEPLVDTFELAFWPAVATADEVIRQASRRGREAHVARTPEGLADLERQRDEELGHPEWGDDRVSDVHRRASRSAVELDHELAQRLAAATDAQLVAVRNRVVRFVCDEVGTARLPWVASALADLDSGRPLPASFGPGTVYARLDEERRFQDHEDPDQAGVSSTAPGWSLFMIISAAGGWGDALDGALEASVNAMAAFDHHRNDDVLAQVLTALDA